MAKMIALDCPLVDRNTQDTSDTMNPCIPEEVAILLEKLDVLEENDDVPLALFKIVNNADDDAVRSLAADVLLEAARRLPCRRSLARPECYAFAFRTMQRVLAAAPGVGWGQPELQDVHLKLLRIFDCVQSKRPRHQYSCLTDEDVLFVCEMLYHYRNCNEHSRILLNLCRQICRTRQYCQVLAKKSFFDSLSAATALTQEYESAARIIRCMYKCPEALAEMKTSDNIVPLISSLINVDVGSRIVKRQLIAALYKVAKKSPEKLSKPLVWNNLLQYFKSNEKRTEKCLHMSAIKIYTLLNLASERKIIPTSNLDYDPGLPQAFAQAIYEDSENDNDYTDEEDEESDDSEEEFTNEPEDSDDELTTVLDNDDDISYMKHFFAEFEGDDGNSNINVHYEDNREVSKTIFAGVQKYDHIKTQAYPDLVAAEADGNDDPFIDPHSNDFDVSHLIERLKNNSNNAMTVYDLDNLIRNDRNVNHDVDFTNTLVFESRFESGNLRTAQQIGDFEYDLFLTPDVRTCRGRQWFYFRVSNMVAGVPYVFNIANFDKINSQFNYGMQPVMFSTRDYLENGSGWKRVGEKIVYYGNHYTNEDHSKQYRSLMFTVRFIYENDECYLAYHYPYTYTRLMTELYCLMNVRRRNIYTRMDNLCFTVKNNLVPLLTVTSRSQTVPIKGRPIVFLAARVHPGESNSSWIMDGILRCLMEDNETAEVARDHYVFKVIPMLNPEGVIFGNTRGDLNGCDLNRCWKNPSKYLQPEIYHAKKLVEYAKRLLNHPIFTFVDVHGHSRKKYFFFYGCNPLLSWNKADKLLADGSNRQTVPEAMTFDENMKTSFCQYKIDKKKESTCRVVMWREFGVKESLTLECSYCCGENKKKMTTEMLRKIGRNLVVALANLAPPVL